MKKIILVFALVFGLTASAQNYPGENVVLLKDKTLKVTPKKEELQKYGYSLFYKDDKLQKNYKKSGTSTPYDALVGKEFKVTAIEPYKNPYMKYTKYKLVLDNPETGKLYYDYDPVSEGNYNFEVIGGLEFPDGHFCKSVTLSDEKPIKPEGVWYKTLKKIEGISLSAYIDKKREDETFLIFFINLNTGEKQFQTEIQKGVTLVFDNGEIMSRSYEEIKPDNDGSNVLSTAFYVFNAADLKFIQEHSIVAVKVGKFEDKIKNGYTIREQIKCMLK